MNDLRMLLEEQNGRNNLLEKKQRKFDSECQSLQVSFTMHQCITDVALEGQNSVETKIN